MNYLVLRILMGMIVIFISTTGMTASINITASFSPSLENPTNTGFTNTTPIFGYCQIHKKYFSDCPNNTFTIDLGVRARGQGFLYASDPDPRDHLYIKIPYNTTVELVNDNTGHRSSLTFIVDKVGAKLEKGDGIDGWEKGSLANPSSGSHCSFGSYLMYVKTLYSFFLWNKSGDICYAKSTWENRDISNSYLDFITISYELKTPNPLMLESGVYTGKLIWSVGPGGEVDLGNKWRPSDTQLTVNFRLTVNHELKVTTTTEDQSISLQPCAAGRTCSVEEGQANWERWMVTRITPQLTGRSNFRLDSSGRFTVYLSCEQQIGSECALKSDNNSSQMVAVQTFLTLPDNIVDGTTKSRVTHRQLLVGKKLSGNVFDTKLSDKNRVGSIDFLVNQSNVDTMLKTRPDTYRGAVTVMFDPSIY